MDGARPFLGAKGPEKYAAQILTAEPFSGRLGSVNRPSPLRARRFLRGLRLRDLSNATCVPDAVLSLVERGEIPLRGRVLHQLAHFYSTPAETLSGEMARWYSRRGGEVVDGGQGDAVRTQK